MKKVLSVLLILCVSISLFAASQAETKTVTESAKGPVQGGTLVVATSADADSMLSYKNRYGGACLSAIYEGLMVFDESGTPQPFLAKSVVGDIASKTYTITLNENIKFHDGSVLNGEVCAWNLNMYKAEGVLSSSFFSNVDYAEATGEYTVVLHLTNWDALIPAALCRSPGWMASKEAHDKNGAEYCAYHPVGTGPFYLTKYEQGVTAVVDRFDDYWQGKPYLDRIEFPIYTTALVAQAALESGEVHVWQASDYNIANYLEKEGFRVVVGAIPYCCYAISFDCMEEGDPLCDIRVRQALAYAIDRDEIATILTNEYASVTNQYVPQVSAFYNTAIEGYTFNLEKAKALLKEAGYENGFKTAVLVYDNMSSLDICLIIKEQLAKIGVELEVKSVDIGSYLLGIDGWGNGMIAHPMTLENGIDSQISAMFRQGLKSGLGVKSFIHPDDLNEVILKGLNSSGEEERKCFQEAMRLIFDEYCMVKAIAVNHKVTIESQKVHDTGIGAISTSSATLWKAWLEN